MLTITGNKRELRAVIDIGLQYSRHTKELDINSHTHIYANFALTATQNN
jgi:hypothetical protein